MKWSKLFILTFLFATLAVFAFQSSLPYLLNNHLVAYLKKKTQHDDFAAHFDLLSPYTTLIRNVQYGEPASKGIHAESVRIHYSPIGLFNKELETISVSGLNVVVNHSANGMAIEGLPVQTGNAARPSTPSFSPLQRLQELSFLPRLFEINNSSCSIRFKNRTFRLPVELEIRSVDEAKQHFEIKFETLLLGEKVLIEGNIDVVNNQCNLTLLTTDLPLHHPNGPFTNTVPIEFSTKASIKGHISGSLLPFTPSFDITAVLKNLIASYGDTRFGPPKNQLESDLLTKIHLTGDTSTLKATVSDIPFNEPIAMTADLGVDIDRTEHGFSGKGGLTVDIPPQNINLLAIPSALLLKTKYTFRRNTSSLTFAIALDKEEITSSSPPQAVLVYNDTKMSLSPQQFSLSGTTTPEGMQADYDLALSDITVRKNHRSHSRNDPLATQKQLNLKGTAIYKSEPKQTTMSGNFRLNGKGLTLFYENIASGKCNYGIDGSVQHQMGIGQTGQSQIEANLSLRDGSATSSKYNITAGGIQANIPVSWPVSKQKAVTGSFDINQITERDKGNIGSLSGDILLSEGHYQIASKYKSSIIPGLKAFLDTDVQLLDSHANISPTVKGELTIPKYHFDSKKIALEEIGALDISGFLELDGSFHADKSGFTGGYEIQLNDTTVEDTANKVAVDGIQLALKVPDILNISSDPSTLSIEKATVDKLNIGPGKVSFQIESPSSILIEESNISWNGGQVELLGTRINVDKNKKQRLMLYCNGLNLAAILRQVGVSNVSGKGKVNGKIPVTLKNGKVTFEDAFLYSTPGLGGTISLKNSDILLTGVPKNTIQYSQLDFASEALKNFTYNWATLDLSFEGEDALLAMKLAGKPKNPLPFSYDTRVGSFIRLDSYSKGIDYPIDLDVNFHLPLNKILSYGNNFMRLFQK